MHPESQEAAIRAAGVLPANVYRDLGVSGATGTASRAGWRAVDAKLEEGDALVVMAIDRLGRKWADVTSVLRDLRRRRVRVESLAESESSWVSHLFAPEGSAEALIGDLLASVLAWVGDAELQAIRRRTKAGLPLRAHSRTPCLPPRALCMSRR